MPTLTLITKFYSKAFNLFCTPISACFINRKLALVLVLLVFCFFIFCITFHFPIENRFSRTIILRSICLFVFFLIKFLCILSSFSEKKIYYRCLRQNKKILERTVGEDFGVVFKAFQEETSQRRS